MSDQKEELLECRLCREKKGKIAWNGVGEISEWTRVCRECIQLWELGRRSLKAGKEDGRSVKVKIARIVPVTAKMGDPKGSTEIKGLDIMAAMGATKLQGTTMGNIWSGPKTEISIVQNQDENEYTYIKGGSAPAHVPEMRAKAMKKIITAFFNAIAKAHVDGFNEGRNILSGLAKGSLKVEDFSEMCDNSRAGRKPKKRDWDE